MHRTLGWIRGGRPVVHSLFHELVHMSSEEEKRAQSGRLKAFRLREVDRTVQVLVTGGAGFVGSNVVDALVARDDDVLVLDDLSTGDAANLEPSGVELVVADIGDREATINALRGRRFEAVVHLASKTKVVQSLEQPDLYRRVIVGGTANVLEAAALAGTARFVNFSSGGVIYGETLGACAHELMPIAPVSPYGACKALAETEVERLGMSALTLRPANIYGPRQRTDLEGGVVAIFQRGWRSGSSLNVRGDGSMQRDYVYVGDVADAVIASLGSDRTGVYNIGTGVATSVLELIEAMATILGPAEVTHVPEIPGELRRNCLDVSKAARDALWRPRTSLAEGLRLTLS
ncbi:MAG: NAD-dependent epimerase/dehydratase family protein [Chloroflexi bacterium]|nr:NAD-dependent epimerase/dehydratase family protein [Chloroflexota bacterium]